MSESTKNNSIENKFLKMGLVTLTLTTAASLVLLSGCTNNDKDILEKSDDVEVVEDNNLNQDDNTEVKEGDDEMTFNQFDMPKKGETVAIMHTTMGDIKIRLFPQYAKKAVENFVTLSKEGKYDGVLFHRVIDDFMIQSGDFTNGDGTGGESIWKKDFEDELDENVLLYRGALAMANRGANTNGSQFFIVQTKEVDEALLKQLENYGISKDIIDGYKEHGGTPHLDFRFTYYAHTVFGQVYEGLDIVDKIAATEVDNQDKPLEDVVINSIDIEVIE